jgi:hypothetical protein
MVFSAYFSWDRHAARAGAHVSVTVDQASGEIESIEVLSALTDDEVATVITEALRAVDGHTTQARENAIEHALDGAKSDVGLGGRISGKAGRFALEAKAVVPHEKFSDVVGAVRVTVDGALVFQGCALDDRARAGVPHEALLRQALDARAGATQKALTRWRDAALGALEEDENGRALPSVATPSDGS